MRSYRYSEFPNSPQAWAVNSLTLDGVNLVVGPNASGKTRLINTIAALGTMIARTPVLQWKSGNWECSFGDGQNTIDLEISVVNSSVSHERIIYNGEERLVRHADGNGKIWFDQVGAMVNFRSTDTIVATVAKRDSLQHPFLEPLFKWAERVRHFQFSTDLGRQTIFLINPQGDSAASDVDAEAKAVLDPNAVVEQYNHGYSKLLAPFDDAILADLKQIGYDCTSIHAVHADEIPFIGGNLPIMLQVQERDLAMPTKQFQMSNGMFRALAIIIHANFAVMSGLDATILIDDIGEGLDYARSSSLIDMLIKKCEGSSVQLLMTSNDRFVMNEVDLKYWHVLNRVGHSVNVLDHSNSKDAFDNFKYLGLSNFDFFSNKGYLGQVPN
ncbi:AAA family ATPase [Sphingomonas aerolata]|uniref:hypothetical protein n=1 Tax=Sphingomonas aerolata TaxID=185951 RepID=UPI00334BAA67